MAYKFVVQNLSIAASEKIQLLDEFAKLEADITALRASIVGINAKLDLDAGVTDTNYAALWNPAARTFVA